MISESIMHELAVTQNVLGIALSHAEVNHATRIVTINLVVGQMASIVDDCVQFYWDMISDGTIAQGATLHFERIAAQMQCEACGQSYDLANGELACPHCGSAAVRLTRGDEFYVRSIEVET
ncbi:MAG: hydrogenase maturation nickel metallochaperone HypA [Anaerolineaceae bacterium]|nr:hydrogenase maturation nickel metallochaperone HypA [Anaerolineaceae bacterium]